MDRIQSLVESVINKLNDLQWALFLLVRVCVGLEFIESGRGKLAGIDHLIKAFEGWGIPAPSIQAPFVATMELVGGICILIGLATRFFSLFMAGIMGVALLTIFTQENVTSLPFDSLGNVLYLPEVLLLLLFLVLGFTGPGKVSIDRIISGKLQSR